jgi:hypothetical protein
MKVEVSRRPEDSGSRVPKLGVVKEIPARVSGPKADIKSIRPPEIRVPLLWGRRSFAALPPPNPEPSRGFDPNKVEGPCFLGKRCRAAEDKVEVFGAATIEIEYASVQPATGKPRLKLPLTSN